jgi:flagellar biosynthesis anti-sigma factor FlgM
MTGITDLSAVFGSSTRVSDADGDAVNVGSRVEGIGHDAGADAGDPSLFNLDQTAVSSAGDALHQAMGTSDVRADKVASLQAAIADGSYSVSSSDVADKLIGSMLNKG